MFSFLIIAGFSSPAAVGAAADGGAIVIGTLPSANQNRASRHKILL
jgi:hypothetical protein